MGCFAALHVLREEFRLKKFDLNGVDEERFYTFQWRVPPIVYLIYRFIVAGYTFSWLIYTAQISSNPPYGWAAYLTNWSYTILTVYLFLHLIITIVHYCLNCRRGVTLFRKIDSEQHQKYFREDNVLQRSASSENITENSDDEIQVVVPKLPFYVKIVWLLFTVISPAALTVTIMFWAAIYPSLKHANPIGIDNIQLHVLNTVIILLEHAVTAVPFRLLHFIYPTIYGLIYIIFSIIFWSGDHNRVIYNILDWSKPGMTVGFVLLIGFVVIPILCLTFFLIHRLKLCIYRKISSQS
ncbi:hypothetical protein SNE40_015013 [Patella caerulea]|uniref:Protein rolling stone n=1 Tax=Patella caerulea TaxID=87958 RepID=A0AAN8JL98_PATCE